MRRLFRLHFTTTEQASATGRALENWYLQKFPGYVLRWRTTGRGKYGARLVAIVKERGL